MTALVFSPYTPGRAIDLSGRLWKKKILPVADVKYQGRTLHFTRGYLEKLVESFRSRAYPHVPFQLADASNAHTNDPERFRGEIVDLDLDGDGLVATVKMTEAGEEILRQNPNLGVSARIVEDYDRSDGKFFPAAIQHVLGTLDPRIPSVSGGWVAVEASNSGQRVIDLSAATWEGLDAEPWEVAAADQALAEADELEKWAATASLDEIIAQAEAEAATTGEAAALNGFADELEEWGRPIGMSSDPAVQQMALDLAEHSRRTRCFRVS